MPTCSPDGYSAKLPPNCFVLIFSYGVRPLLLETCLDSRQWAGNRASVICRFANQISALSVSPADLICGSIIVYNISNLIRGMTVCNSRGLFLRTHRCSLIPTNRDRQCKTRTSHGFHFEAGITPSNLLVRRSTVSSSHCKKVVPILAESQIYCRRGALCEGDTVGATSQLPLSLNSTTSNNTPRSVRNLA